MVFDMFFHSIYHVDQSLATNLCCCFHDLLYFTVDEWKAFEIINVNTPQILPSCIDRFCLEFIHYCFDKIYFISNAEGFPIVHDLAVASSAADAASPLILLCLPLNLYLNLHNHSLLALKGLVSPSVPSFF
jgi:NADPH-dependent 7-cyano-7-deazaguanine reductase QueF-like protein